MVQGVTKTLARRDLEALDAGREVTVAITDRTLPVTHLALRGDGQGGLAVLTLVTESAEAAAFLGRHTDLLVRQAPAQWQGLELQVKFVADVPSYSSSSLPSPLPTAEPSSANTGGTGGGSAFSGSGQGSDRTTREDVIQALERQQRRSGDMPVDAGAAFRSLVVAHE
jgi:hypothetical protein